MNKKLLGWYDLVREVVDYDSSSDVVTPLDLARQMVRDLPTSGRMLIPGSGIGTFAIAAALEGRDPNTITCIDYNKRYHALATRFFSEHGINFIYGDYLSWNPHMKFDVIIGNPPYQDMSTNSKDKKLWTRFVDNSLENLAPEGLLIFVTPNSLVGRTRLPAKRRSQLSSTYSLDWINHNANSYFPQVGVDVCSWCVTNRKYQGVTTVIDGDRQEKIDLRVELPTPFDRKNIEYLTEKIYAHIGDLGIPALQREYNDVDQTPVEDGKYLNYYSGRNKSFRTNDECKNTGKLKVVFSFSATYKQWFITSGNVSGSNLYVEVSSIEEGLEIGETLLHPIVMFYLDNWRRTAGYCPAVRNVGAMPDIRGLSDEEIAQRLNLTSEEVNYIMSNHIPYKTDIQRVLI